MKALASISLGLVLLVALLFLLRRTPDAESGAPGNSAAAFEHDEAPAAPAAPSEPAGGSDPRLNSRAEVAPQAEDASTPASAIDLGPSLRGTVVVLDERGLEVPEPSGVFTLWLRSQGQDGSTEVAFERGVWSTRFNRAGTDSVAVLDAKVGTRFARVDSPAKGIPLPESMELEVRLTLPPRARLHVLDAETAVELTGITLVKTLKYPLDVLEHPGQDFAERVVARGLTSPIGLDPYQGELAVWDDVRTLVGVEGYAWALATVDLMVGGEHQVLLRRGGALDLEVRGARAAAPETRLRFRSPTEPLPLLEIPLGAQTRFRIDGLRPGPLRIGAEFPRVASDSRTFGETTVQIASGSVAHAVLELTPPPELAVADVTCIVHVDKAWQCRRLVFRLRPLEASTSGQASSVDGIAVAYPATQPGFHAFRLRIYDLAVGSYLLELEHPSASWVLDVPPEGLGVDDLVIGAPVELRLRVLDAATGAELRTAHVGWHARPPVPRPTGLEQEAQFDANVERYVVRSAAVPIELWVTEDGYLPSFSELDLSTGITEHTVQLERACAIVLRLKSADAALTIPTGWSDSPTSPSTGGETRMVEFGTSEVRFVVSAPGTYELTPPKLPGYKEPPLQRIEVFSGKDTVHVVEYELER